MKNTELILSKGKLTFALLPSAVARRDALLEQLKGVKTVNNAGQQDIAALHATQARRVIKDVEASRKLVKRPLLDKEAEVDALAKSYCEPLLAEMERIAFLITAFQDREAIRVQKEREAQEQALRKAQEEAKRKEQEQQELQLRASRAGATKQDVKAALKAANTAALVQTKVEQLVRAPEPEANKASGAVTRQDIAFEVLDINALYKARPDLCNPPTARASAIKACCVPGVDVPGLKLWWEKSTSFRSA